MSLFSAISHWFQTEAAQVLTAGFAGAAVSAVMEWNGYIPATRRLFVGTISAFYLSPIGIPIIKFLLSFVLDEVPTENLIGLGGFVMGVTGIIIIEIMVKTLQLHKAGIGKK